MFKPNLEEQALMSPNTLSLPQLEPVAVQKEKEAPVWLRKISFICEQKLKMVRGCIQPHLGAALQFSCKEKPSQGAEWSPILRGRRHGLR